MIAIVVIPPPSPEMLNLDNDQSRALLPLGDRSVLQHIVEALVTQGVTSIEVIAGHAPEKIEALLGNGVRWGCNFRYHLTTQDEHPYRALKVIQATRTEPWALVHADRFPCQPLPSAPIVPQLFMLAPQSDFATAEINVQTNWGGVAVFPAGDLANTISQLSQQELRPYLAELVKSGAAEGLDESDWIDASNPAALLETQAQLLAGKLNGLIISGIEREPGIWISRNVRIHPSAKLISPVYVGPNCRINEGVRLGPDVALSGNCIVDSGTVMAHSLALAGSYIGERLELSRNIVDHDLLVNVRLRTKVNIGEKFLLGSVEPRDRESFVWQALQSFAAALLLLLFLPILLISWLYFALVRRISYATAFMARSPLAKAVVAPTTFKLPCIGQDAWSTHRSAGWSAFTRQFLPGLFAVLPGRLSLVGLPPRTPEQLVQMPHEWRSLYTRNRSGLISEAALAATDSSDPTQLYLADAYYAAKKSWVNDIKLTGQYMMRLIYPARP